MSKPPAKAAAKTAAVSKAPAKTAKPSAKPAAKPVAKAAPAKAPAVQPAPSKSSPSKSVATKPVAAKSPAAKPVPAPAAPSKAAAAKPTAKTAAPVKPAAKAAAPAVASKPPAPPVKTSVPAPSTKTSGASKAAAAAPTPQPTPAPAANRFTDRFAPAVKSAARPIMEVAEAPKPAHKVDPKLANAWKSKPGRELSEPELLAMPDTEYMNDKQLDFFRARLQQQKDELLSSAGETTEHLREDTSIVPDPVDRATIEEEHALELRTRDRERKLLKKIAQSLGRLETGEYGYCDETGEPIGLQRLMARPTATLSLEAQQRRELKQKMFGD